MELEGSAAQNDPYLIGSTNRYTESPAGLHDGETASADNLKQPAHNGDSIAQEPSYFKSAQWSLDGTTILTSSADNTLRTYLLYSPPYVSCSPNYMVY